MTVVDACKCVLGRKCPAHEDCQGPHRFGSYEYVRVVPGGNVWDRETVTVYSCQDCDRHASRRVTI